MIRSADRCTTIGEVRAAIDCIDAQIVEALARRFAFIDAAARIKPARGLVRDEQRKAQVLANVDRAAAAAGLDRTLAARLWDQLIEASIAHELCEFDRLNADGRTFRAS